MHSHDRTMLASLGFADDDKKNPAHDRASLYLTQKETETKIGDWFCSCVSSNFRKNQIKNYEIKSKTEFHIQKGEGKYATTVGFLDVAFAISIEISKKAGDSRYGFSFFAEVKIAKVSIGEVLRQMGLYKLYYPSGMDYLDDMKHVPRGILVAPWDLTESELSELRAHQFDFIKLGAAFDEWNKTVSPPSKPGLEL